MPKLSTIITSKFNFLTINKGKNQGLEKEMAVINSKGIIGITDNANEIMLEFNLF